MKKTLFLLTLAFVSILSVHAQWKPAGERIKTTWGENLKPENVLPEYPRPIMERKDWSNLNGLWKYAIIHKGSPLPTKFEGDILVPFAIESSLSGVGKTVGINNELVYQRNFIINPSWTGKNVLLHFGAVDWKAEVYVNDVKVGSHTGGYTPFSFDITPVLQKGNNKLVVRVWDGTDSGYQPRGKQVSNPNGIWYTSVTGIWQTVWLEPVTPKHIENLLITPDIDNRMLKVEPIVANAQLADMVAVNVYDGDKLVASGKSINGQPVEVTMPEDFKLWSPDSPFLYKLKVSLLNQGKNQIDQVSSYTAMRKFSLGRDSKGVMRMQLNNKPIFQLGPLDQGWWPDGLYTAPTDEALRYDVQKTKDWGFNMIRKHVKVEPARWYKHCDELGIIVWQDMPSGDKSPEWQMHQYYTGSELKRTPESEANYRKEWQEIMDYLYSYPCIGTWVPFNEAWGQFKTQEIAEWTKKHDPSRLVNPASGGNFYTTGDILDLHNYPHPDMYLYDAQRATVLGEYGGIGMPVKDHTWKNDQNWGYISFEDSKAVTDQYVKYAQQLYDFIGKGFSAGVYTQTTDVEVEVNGLMTYDRKIIKMDEKRIHDINYKLTHALETSGNPVFPGWYADPEGAVFENQYWIYPTLSWLWGEDAEKYAADVNRETIATMKDYNLQTHLDAFSSPDLVHWTKHPEILHKRDVKWLDFACWAPAIIHANDQYYLFFGGNDVHEGEVGGIGVATSKSPAGPFKDALGKPLIPNIVNGAQPIDQFVFEDNGNYYMYYGGWQHCNMVKLAPDLLSIVPFEDGDMYKEVTPENYVEGPFMLKRNGKYYFMWSEGGWTGPNYCVAYAIADTPFGPFKRVGKILEQDSNVAVGAGHHSVIQVPGKDEYYIVYHRRPLDRTGASERQVCIDKLEFDEQGFIKPVKMTFTGVAPRPIE